MIDSAPPRVKIAEYEAFIALPENADRRFELIHGEIVEKMPNQRHGIIIFILSGHIFNWWSAKGEPGTPGIEVRHGLPDDDENDRIPDLSYISPERAEPIRERGALPIMPDLAVEIMSPDDSLSETRDKMKYYLEHGTRLSWLFIPRKKLIEVYRAGGDIEILTAADDDTLDGGDVLPGFTVKLSVLF
ncbi:MAG: Uma2 family endonuclease [Chloroflexota bacterium]|nr:Uma2 family endonuclease [Chloroflexota bacterium]